MTGRLIDAEALKAQIQREIDRYFDENGGGIHTAMEARDEIDYAPTVDAVPVRHGKWIPCMTDSRGCTDMFKCSECKRYSYYAYGVKQLDYKYCPHCGAKMDAQEQPSLEESDQLEDHAEELLRAEEILGNIAEELGKVLSEIAEKIADVCNEYIKSEDADDRKTD
jgi:hypothetical protein